MPKRYGITNDTPRRKRELELEYEGLRNFRIEKEFPNQEAAQDWEDERPNTHPGGPKADGPYFGYSHEYTRRR